MALKKKISITGTQYVETEGARYPVGDTTIELDAYIRVTNVIAKKPTSFIDVEFKQGESWTGKEYKFEADLSDGAANHIKQAYEYLKTLPEFAGAEDC